MKTMKLDTSIELDMLKCMIHLNESQNKDVKFCKSDTNQFIIHRTEDICKYRIELTQISLTGITFRYLNTYELPNRLTILVGFPSDEECDRIINDLDKDQSAFVLALKHNSDTATWKAVLGYTLLDAE